MENFELKQEYDISQKKSFFYHFYYKEQIEILIEVKKDLKALETMMIFKILLKFLGLMIFEISMKALEVFTIDSSSEFAI